MDQEFRTADQRLALAREWDEVLAEVRRLPGFEDFLRPPSLTELLTASEDGPVVVLNVSRWRSDALIVTHDGVQATSLPDLTLEEAHSRLESHLAGLASFEKAIEDRAAAYAAAARSPLDYSLLREAARARRAAETANMACEIELVRTCAWLWTVVVAPVVTDLGLKASDEPARVWWCPTGPLTLLPIHAAGRDQEWLADIVISSYTPTVRALVDARRPRPPRAKPDGFLVVSALADSHSPLADLLADLGRVEVLSRTSVDEVRSALVECSFVHFDCHADQDLQDPSQGGLVLPDGQLRVFDLAEVPLKGEYAALAACKTAVGGLSLLDESITLAAALHYTGFRHVIGSLWNLSDSAAALIFEAVYRDLTTTGRFTPSGSALALSRATTQLRRSGASIHDWAALVHIGP